MPRAHRNRECPCDPEHETPANRIERRVPARIGSDDTVPGDDVRLGFVDGQGLDGSEPSPGLTQDVVEREETNEGEQQVHDGIRQHHAFRAGIDRERGVTDPDDQQRHVIGNIHHFRYRQRCPLGHSQQIGGDTPDHRYPRGGLNAPTVEALAEELGDGERLAASDIAAKERCAQDVAGDIDPDQDHQDRAVPLIRKPGFSQEGGGAQVAGNQGAGDQQGRAVTPRNEIIINIFDPPASVIADQQIDHDARDDAEGVGVHGSVYAPAFERVRQSAACRPRPSADSMLQEFYHQATPSPPPLPIPYITSQSAKSGRKALFEKL